MQPVYIGLGSNEGDREANLLAALDALGRIDAVAVSRRSSLWDSAPFGPPQPRYLNAVVELDCALSPKKILGICGQIERDLGRKPGERWGPRPIDLDILLWGDDVVAEPNLQVPHLGLHGRRFVLEPLCELCPERVHPVLGMPIHTLLRKLAPQDVVRMDSEIWLPE